MEQYWASVEPEELAKRVQEKVDCYYQTINSDGKLGLWKNAYRHYYGLDDNGWHTSAKAMKGGDSGELVKVKSNHYRNLAQHLINLTTQSRPSFEARSLNTDYQSQAACILGQQVLDWNMKERGLEALFRQAVEYAVALCGESFWETDWNFDAGGDYDINPATGQQVKSGEPDFRVYHAVDAIREHYQDEDGKADWFILRKKVSRFRLAALYPDQAEEIMRLPVAASTGEDDLDDHNAALYTSESDRITVYKVWHERCPEMPQGLRAIVASGETLLEYGPLPKKMQRIPVRRLAPANQVKTPYGYTSCYDLMAIGDVIDMLYSAATSNNASFSVQHIWTPPGSGLKPYDLGKGMTHLESTVEPKAIQLTATAPELYNLVKMLEGQLETLSGVNSVARGNPDGALKGASGSALALLQSMTISFASGLQASYASLVEGVGDDTITNYKAHATMPQVATLVGKTNRSHTREFIGQDLDPVSKVVVDMGNPAARTAAGRLQIADNLLAQGLITDPDKYLEVLSTGRLEPVTESRMTRQMLIRSENEVLKDGGNPPVIISDLHHEHVPEHLSILDDPETRSRPDIVERVLAHVQEHLNLWPTMDPAMAMLLQMPQPPMPQMPQMPGQEMQGQQPAPAGQPPQDAPVPEGPTDGMPAMPVNPLTNERAPTPQEGAT